MPDPARLISAAPDVDAEDMVPVEPTGCRTLTRAPKTELLEL